jgi:hypothetical protein
MDENGNPVEKASLKVKSRDVGFQTTKYGEFWRILLPGIYKLEVNNSVILKTSSMRLYDKKEQTTVENHSIAKSMVKIGMSVYVLLLSKLTKPVICTLIYHVRSHSQMVKWVGQ